MSLILSGFAESDAIVDSLSLSKRYPVLWPENARFLERDGTRSSLVPWNLMIIAIKINVADHFDLR